MLPPAHRHAWLPRRGPHAAPGGLGTRLHPGPSCKAVWATPPLWPAETLKANGDFTAKFRQLQNLT